MINAAIVGLGYIGKVHLRTLLRIPGVNVVALAGRRLGPLEELAAMYNIPKVTADYRTLLDDPPLMWCTTAPNHLHYEVNHAFIGASKHILSEKPLGRSAEETEPARNWPRKDVLTAISFLLSLLSGGAEAAVRIRQGELGGIYTVMGSYLQDCCCLIRITTGAWKSHLPASQRDWRYRQPLVPLSPVYSGLPNHRGYVDLKTTLPVRKKPAGDGTYWYPVQVEDYGSVLVHFANGASGVHSQSAGGGKKCAIDVQVYGSQSSLRWNTSGRRSCGWAAGTGPMKC